MHYGHDCQHASINIRYGSQARNIYTRRPRLYLSQTEIFENSRDGKQQRYAGCLCQIRFVNEYYTTKEKIIAIITHPFHTHYRTKEHIKAPIDTITKNTQQTVHTALTQNSLSKTPSNQHKEWEYLEQKMIPASGNNWKNQPKGIVRGISINWTVMKLYDEGVEIAEDICYLDNDNVYDTGFQETNLNWFQQDAYY